MNNQLTKPFMKSMPKGSYKKIQHNKYKIFKLSTTAEQLEKQNLQRKLRYKSKFSGQPTPVVFFQWLYKCIWKIL